jgi:hypothetical protein
MHHDAARLEVNLFRQALEQGDEQAREQLDQYLQGMLLDWLVQHPLARLALEYGPPESYITAALCTFWQTITHQKRSPPRFASLACLLAFLRGCLNSALLDAARQASPYQQHLCAANGTEGVASRPAEGAGKDLWRSIERALPERRERLLVELRYVRGERPQEIVASHPQAFSHVEEVYRLEREILQHLCLRGDLRRM